MSLQYIRYRGQGQLVRLSYHEHQLQSPAPRSSTRGAVTTFSRRSRKRLLEQTAKIDIDRYAQNEKVIFITLTYGQKFPDPHQAKKHLFNMIKRLRRFAPEASGLWRMEFQQRGAPHFHLVLFHLPFISKESVKQMWHEIIGDGYADMSSGSPAAPFTRIEAISNPRKAMSYVAKYVAKVEPGAGSGFNDVPYLAASESIGRLWGVINRKALPLAELIEIVVALPREECHKVLWQYKRLMSHKWQRANKSGRYNGSSLFVERCHSWQRAFLWCISEYCRDKSHLTRLSIHQTPYSQTMLASYTAKHLIPQP